MKYYAGTVDGKDYGFYLNTEKLQNGWIEVSEEVHDQLIKDANENGKIIKFENNKIPYLIDYIPTEEEKEKYIRNLRNNYLYSTDKYLLSDFPISEEELNIIKSYRQYLRDIPKDLNFPNLKILTLDDYKNKS